MYINKYIHIWSRHNLEKYISIIRFYDVDDLGFWIPSFCIIVWVIAYVLSYTGSQYTLICRHM